MPTTFHVGQLVRLTGVFHQRPSGFVPKQVVTFSAGSVFTVVLRAQARPFDGMRRALNSDTVVVRNSEGTWCIPERLLEAVEIEATEVANKE